MSTAICYFSATGNGFDIANKVQKHLKQSELFFLPNCSPESLIAFDRVILISPVYLFGLPNNVKSFISSLTQLPGQRYSMILHYGGFSANARSFAYDFCKASGINLDNVYKMTMPENFTIFMSPPRWYSSFLLKKSKKKITKIASAISSDTTTIVKRNIFAFCDSIHIENSPAWMTMASKFLVVSPECTHCGYCAEICTQNNIRIENDLPIFSDNCVSCLACYHRCPIRAINYLDKTNGKPRYQNSEVDFSTMK